MWRRNAIFKVMLMTCFIEQEELLNMLMITFFFISTDPDANGDIHPIANYLYDEMDDWNMDILNT